MDEAACRGADTEMFYDGYRWADAAKHCQECPVKLQCRQDFAYDPYAFAGGMTPGQRAAWVRAQSKARRAEPRKRGNGGYSKVTSEQKAKILELFDTEMIGTKEIAERSGVARSTAQRVLRLNGRVRTPEQLAVLARRGGISGGQARKGERSMRMVMQLIGEGRRPSEVAELTGLSKSHVSVIIRKAKSK